MWKAEHRLAADRRGLRYSSDLSDPEWALIEPTPRQRLRASCPQGRRLHPPSQNPTHAPQTGSPFIVTHDFPDRL